MSSPFAFSVLQPAYTNEDYFDTILVSGSGPIAGWTLEAELLDWNGTFVMTPTVTIVDADERTVRIAIVGESLDAGDYTVNLRRTDPEARTLVCYASLIVTNPAAANAWGAPQ